LTFVQCSTFFSDKWIGRLFPGRTAITILRGPNLEGLRTHAPISQRLRPSRSIPARPPSCAHSSTRTRDCTFARSEVQARRSIVAGTASHGCRRESYPDSVGGGKEGSANEPTETTIRSGSSGSV
jgi:hypothetical protein